ncbi:MAG: hypothetical protein WKF37_06120 [Bryobacteraceae bacterium]
MAPIVLHQDRLSTGRASFRLERTLRVPSEGGPYPLPPTFGPFPIRRLRGHTATYFVGLHPWEALWFAFEAAAWKPNALQVFSGGVNVLTGDTSGPVLSERPQNYLVVPDQPWLDGFKTDTGIVNQFVAAPLGLGKTVEEQLGQNPELSGLQIRVIEPKAGRFPARAPRGFNSLESYQEGVVGLAAGGKIEQKIYPDSYGLETWDEKNDRSLRLLLLDGAGFHNLTGESLPDSPISAADYNRMGLPWFRLHDQLKLDIEATPALKSIAKL